MKKKKFRFRDSIQRHHLVYPSAQMSKKGRVTILQPEEVAYIFGKEHSLITRLDRFRYVSSGFIKCLKFFIALKEDKVVKLTRKDWLKERGTKENVVTSKDIEKLKEKY